MSGSQPFGQPRVGPRRQVGRGDTARVEAEFGRFRA